MVARCRVLFTQFAFLALAFNWRPSGGRSLSLSLPRRTQYAIQYTLALITVVSLLVTLYRTPSVVPKPHRPGSRIVRTGIWTVHFGIDNEGRDSQRAIRDLVRCVISQALKNCGNDLT